MLPSVIRVLLSAFIKTAPIFLLIPLAVRIYHTGPHTNIDMQCSKNRSSQVSAWCATPSDRCTPEHTRDDRFWNILFSIISNLLNNNKTIDTATV